MGLEHHLGLTCDPVCGLVQIPCIERNAYAAARALDSNLYASFSDGRHSVSFDRIVEVMKQTGHDLPSIYKETAQGGPGRYKIDLKTMTRKYDFLVIGSGIAGMSFALKVASKGKVALICKTTLDEANTALAQGGVASVTNLEVDDFEKHINDTMIAGDWLSDPEAVRKVVTEAPGQIRELINWGVDFDKKEDGSFDLHREGGHSEFRILHHADNTGFEIRESLIKAVRSNPDIDIFEHHFAIEIITQHHLGKIVTRRTPDITCYGAYVLDTQTGEVDTFLSRITLIATGGVGAAHQTTTNPLVATGDGIAMVYRAKGTVKDMEFIQFHPTALYHPGDRPNFLITEAMRGYGAVLRNLKGEEFMHKYDPRLSLAPRDIVARAIDSEMKLTGDDHVYLDVTHKDPEETRRHFPNIYAKCLSLGIDITKDYIPVAPAAHYLCGGIKVDSNAESSIRRLYAVGECSCTGLHGGNRPGIQLADRGCGLCRCSCRTRHCQRLALRVAHRCALPGTTKAHATPKRWCSSHRASRKSTGSWAPTWA